MSVTVIYFYVLGAIRLEARFLSAAITSNLRQVQACLNEGVNVNVYIRQGSNALHMAAERGDIPLAITLALSPNLNYNAKTDYGYTPLMLACLIKKRSFVRFLMKHKVNPNVQDRYGRTALHFICRVDAINLAFELFKYQNVDPNIKDCYGATPLLVALFEANSLHMAKLLLKNGATLEVGVQRNLPLFLECVTLCTTIKDIPKVLLLVQAGADVNMVDRITGKTVLHFIAFTGCLPLASHMLAIGAKANRKDVAGRVASEVALIHGNYLVYKLFKEKELETVAMEEQERAREREERLRINTVEMEAAGASKS